MPNLLKWVQPKNIIARIFCLSLFWTSIAFAQEPEYRILLPIEVIGDEGLVEEVELTLTPEQAAQTNLFWLQVNNLGYENKASVQINSEEWLNLNHETTQIQSPEKERGGMAHGGYSTIRFTIPSTGLTSGVNTLRFRFNMSDAISNGYRVVKFNLLDINGNKILDESYFEEDDPLLWEAPYTDAESIEEGKGYWNNEPLLSNYLEPGKSGFWYGYALGGSQAINAKCASCHTQDGRDLEIFSYSNKSIIERAKFHNLTEEQGKKIASYIRSLSEEHDNVGRYGRPWNPPYQPGPEIADRPIEEWAAGAGLDAVLEADKDMLPHMFPEGVDQEKVYDRFDSEKMVDRTTLPVAIQFPDWKHWLPMIHPMDAYTKDDYWNDPLKFGGKATIHPKEGYKDFRNYLEAMPPASRDPGELMEENRKFWYHHRFFLAQRHDGDNSLGGHWREEKSRATTKLADDVPREFAATSLARLMAVKYFEVMNEFDLQDKAHWFAKPEDQPASRQWFGTMYQVFEIPAHFQACVEDQDPGDGIDIVGNCTSFYGQSKETGEYESTNWYHLQLIVNGGNGMVSHNSPMDYNYHPSFILRASSSSGIYEPLRYYHSMNAMYQFRSWSGATTPNDGKGFRIRVQGPWHIIGRSDSNQLFDFAESIWPTFLDKIKPGMSKWVLNAQLRQFLTEVRKPENNLENWNRLDNGGSNELDAKSKTTSQLKEMSNYVGLDYWADKFYYLFPEFAKLGVDCQILEEMIDWCSEAWPNIDWEPFRSSGELQLDLEPENNEACAVTSNKIRALAFNEGEDPTYEWWVNGDKISNKTPELDIEHIRPGVMIKCRVTSSKNCVANSSVETELALPQDGFVVKVRKNGAQWEELSNTFACIDDTMEFKIDPQLETPLFWLDAMDISNDGSEPEEGTTISQWVNKSTSDYSMPEQSNSGLRPSYSKTGMNGKPALMFGANNANGLELIPTSNDEILSQNWTMVITGTPYWRGYWNSLVGNENGDDGFGFHINGDNGRSRTKMNGEQVHGRYFDDGTDMVVMIEKEGKKIKVTINGKLEEEFEQSSSNMTSSRAFYLGQVAGGNSTTNWYHKGPISEVIFYDHIITESQKNYLEGYLMHKWKIDQDIPLDHAFKAHSPLYLNLKTPNGEHLVFDKNISTNEVVLNQNAKFGDFIFTRPNCTESSAVIGVTNEGLIGDDAIKYSVNEGKYIIGNSVSLKENNSLELLPNYEFDGDYQWEDPEGTLLERNVNPEIFTADLSMDQKRWKLHFLQDIASCADADKAFEIVLNVDELPDSEKDDDLDGVMNDVDLCPDSKNPSFVNRTGCFELPGNNFSIEAIGETCVDSKNGSITISAAKSFDYTLRLNDSENYNFNTDLSIENLTAGNYSICISVTDEPDYEQCFNLTVEAAEEISGKTVRTKNGEIITETTSITSGTAPFTISVNGETLFSTYDNNFAIDVNHGDQVSVSSKFECEGILMSDINLIDHFTAYPNPTTDYVDILVPTIKREEVSVSVVNMLQQKVLENSCTVANGRIRVHLNHLPRGLYFISLHLEAPVNFKIMKE